MSRDKKKKKKRLKCPGASYLVANGRMNGVSIRREREGEWRVECEVAGMCVQGRRRVYMWIIVVCYMLCTIGRERCDCKNK